MAKKAANTAPQETSSLVKKAVAPRTRKHVKAQASAVAAAVEEFVSAIVHPAKPVDVTPESAAVPEVAAKATPTHEEVSRLAYRLYLERGGKHGSPAEDWVRAEQTLRG